MENDHGDTTHQWDACQVLWRDVCWCHKVDRPLIIGECRLFCQIQDWERDFVGNYDGTLFLQILHGKEQNGRIFGEIELMLSVTVLHTYSLYISKSVKPSNANLQNFGSCLSHLIRWSISTLCSFWKDLEVQ